MTGTKVSGRKRERVRIDRLLADRGLVESREKARALVLAGNVLVNGQKIVKAGMPVPADADIRILGERMPYVSRGGVKLEAALRAFGVEVSGLTALDVGASTGGFTDCLLQHGAAKVYAVDVGYGQMAWKLRRDPRIVLFERMNVKVLGSYHIPEPVDIAVIDVSFISLEKVVPHVLRFLRAGGDLIALIKPQFEAGKGQIGKGGIVRDEEVRKQAVDKITEFIRSLGMEVKGVITSPITGQDGNVEYLMSARLDTRTSLPAVSVDAG